MNVSKRRTPKSILMPVVSFFSALLLTVNVHAAAEKDAVEAVEQGAYLVKIGDCVACHNEVGGQEFAGGSPFDTPFGIVYSTNITSDKETGIGNYSYDDFYDVMHNGVAPKGNLYPAMPYTSYHGLSDEDTKALYAYFMQVKPVNRENKELGISFPFNIRMGLKGWNLLNNKDEHFKPNPTKSERWNRGDYLVNVLGHCGECHTPRNVVFAMEQDKHFEGEVLGSFEAPNITPEELNRQNWTHDDLTNLFVNGYSRKGTVFGGMYPVVYHSYSKLTEEDLRSVSTYLLDNDDDIKAKALTNKGHDKALPGYKTYMAYCAGCHGQEGSGVPNVTPAMAGNATIDRKSPYNVASILLNGIEGQHYKVTSSFYAMPSYATELNDEEMKDLINYLRVTWSEQAGDMTTSDMSTIRENMKVDLH